MNGQDKYICLKKLDFQKLSKSTNKDKKICEICFLLNNKERRSTLTNWNRKRIRSMQGSPWKHSIFFVQDKRSIYIIISSLNLSILFYITTIYWTIRNVQIFFSIFLGASGGAYVPMCPLWIRPWYHRLARLFVYQFVIKIILNLKNTLSQLIIHLTTIIILLIIF